MIKQLITNLFGPKPKPYHWLQNRFQFILLTLVETHTLRQVSEKYFSDMGIGYLKRVMIGKSVPHELIMKSILKNVPQEYHDKYTKYVEYEKSFKGW